MPHTLTFLPSPEKNDYPFAKEKILVVSEVREIVYPYLHSRTDVPQRNFLGKKPTFIPRCHQASLFPAENVPALFITYEAPAGQRTSIAPFCTRAEYEEAAKNAEEGRIDITPIQRKNRNVFIRDVVPRLMAEGISTRTRFKGPAYVWVMVLLTFSITML